LHVLSTPPAFILSQDQTLRWLVLAFNASNAAASSIPRLSGARNKKNVKREAVFGPIPGKAENASMIRWTGSGSSIVFSHNHR
jgi:hypothetical protein